MESEALKFAEAAKFLGVGLAGLGLAGAGSGLGIVGDGAIAGLGRHPEARDPGGIIDGVNESSEP